MRPRIGGVAAELSAPLEQRMLAMRRSTALLTLLLAACQYHPQVVPLAGESHEIQQLTGRWEGRYTGVESGRTGTITFEVNARGDSAYGDVLLTVPGFLEPPIPIDPRDVHLAHVATGDLLSIQFVRIAGNEVRGTIEPYRAPDCGCVVSTAFTGRIDGNRVSGRFVTRLPNGRRQHGTWRVGRIER